MSNKTRQTFFFFCVQSWFLILLLIMKIWPSFVCLFVCLWWSISIQMASQWLKKYSDQRKRYSSMSFCLTFSIKFCISEWNLLEQYLFADFPELYIALVLLREYWNNFIVASLYFKAGHILCGGCSTTYRGFIQHE